MNHLSTYKEEKTMQSPQIRDQTLVHDLYVLKYFSSFAAVKIGKQRKMKSTLHEMKFFQNQKTNKKLPLVYATFQCGLYSIFKKLKKKKKKRSNVYAHSDPKAGNGYIYN